MIFNKTYIKENQPGLAFIKSKNVQVFPCGRRRSMPITANTGDQTGDEAEKYYIPFDPEARLNTEANNRRHSSINGYKQSYLKSWDVENKKLFLVLAGYIFSIDLTDNDAAYDLSLASEFGSALYNYLLANNVSAINATKIYANILIKDIQLFEGTPRDYSTGMLHNQTEKDNSINDAVLDLLQDSTLSPEEPENPENYYFSGLSFSIGPLATSETEETLLEEEQVSEEEGKTIKKTIISLCILDLVDTTWKLHEPSKLPKIEHGLTEDSVIITDLTTTDLTTTDLTTKSASVTERFKVSAVGDITLKANEEAEVEGKISAKKIRQNGKPVPTISLSVFDSGGSDSFYQLQIITDPSTLAAN